ncbi:hypothetical protein QBC39DRAFT_383019 [Podospora conica]|nr:hypothetical protein QBC39DRAFT_383019 [Schizothecium conicum]
MFSVLPDLTPRDSHTLWYTSTRHPLPTASLDASSLSDANRLRGGQGPGGGPNNAVQSALAIDRSLLGRLRDDERLHERRRANAGNMGQTWLKPPGVTKTLFQLREERREAEEHAEAMRREMVAQELAEAEAANATGATGMMDDGGEGVAAAVRMDGDGDEVMMMEGEEDMSGMGGRDLDDDIPDADDGGFGFDGVSDDEEEEEEEDEEDEEDSDDEEGEESYLPAQARLGRRQTNEVANIRAVEDRMRQMIARGGGASVGGDLYGADEDVDEEDQAHILEEDDLVGAMYPDELEPDMDMGMDANLDDDIPEAESGGYEHTDSEASLSSDEEASEQNVSYGGMRTPHLPPPRSSLPGGSTGRSVAAGGSWRFSARRGPRSSLDLSSILSRDGSSAQGSSPRLQRRG